MKLYWSFVCLISFLLVSSCTTVMFLEKEGTMPTSVEIHPAKKKPGAMLKFMSLLNSSHPGNKIGYRFFEHKPFVYGEVPQYSKTETDKANALEREYTKRPGVVVNTIDVTNKQNWVPQVWTYYIVPVADGFELLWVIETKDEGLNEYYVAQQCFRMSGKTNEKWRLKIAEAPAFSEYDLWAKQEAKDKPRSSLSFVRRDNRWEALPAVREHVVCRTPLGVAMDTARTGGDLSKITGMEPYSPSRFEAPVDCGLTTRSNLKNTWVCALYWENISHISNHHPADCLHSFVNLGPLASNSKHAIHGKVYWMKASRDELFARWQKEWPN